MWVLNLAGPELFGLFLRGGDGVALVLIMFIDVPVRCKFLKTVIPNVNEF
jgi:hypothetical protein